MDAVASLSFAVADTPRGSARSAQSDGFLSTIEITGLFGIPASNIMIETRGA
jgi:hypothetical protein